MAIEVAILNDLCLSDCVTKEQAERAFNQLFDLLLTLDNNGTEVCLVVPYYDMAFGYLGAPLYKLLFEEPCFLNVPPEKLRQLMILLGKCVPIEFDRALIVNVNDSVGAIPCDSYAYVAAHLHSESGESYFGILGRIGGRRVGAVKISCGIRESESYIFASAQDLTAFFRRGIEFMKPIGADFLKIANKAYPNLQFHPKAAVEDLQLDLNLHMPTVVHHLAFLDEDIKIIGDQCGWDAYRMQRIALAKGVNFSDESANTKKDAAKIKRRNVNFGTDKKTNIVCCSYHTKILPNEGRIHFFPSNPEFPGKVLIGLFHNHLPI